jgi:hypothetical protein
MPWRPAWPTRRVPRNKAALNRSPLWTTGGYAQDGNEFRVSQVAGGEVLLATCLDLFAGGGPERPGFPSVVRPLYDRNSPAGVPIQGSPGLGTRRGAFAHSLRKEVPGPDSDNPLPSRRDSPRLSGFLPAKSGQTMLTSAVRPAFGHRAPSSGWWPADSSNTLRTESAAASRLPRDRRGGQTFP